MEQVKIKNRLFEIEKIIRDDIFVGQYKGKKYFIRKYDPKSDDGRNLAFCTKILSSTGVPFPKVYFIDKKLGYTVCEYLEGENLVDVIGKDTIPESILEQVFNASFMAKVARVTLCYEPDKFMVSNGKLFYVYPNFIKYDAEKDFVKRYLRLWFDTKELEQYLKKFGIIMAKTRLKNEYLTNKEMVLATVKYYK